MLIKLCVAVAGLIVLLIGYQHITALAKEYQGRYYDYSITSASVVLARPAVAFLAGWTVLQALQVFAKLSPFKDPWAKRLRWSVIISVAVYVFLSLPVLTIYLFGVDITTAMPRFISDAWCYASYWLMGIYYNMHVKPNAILFGILGCMFWLGCPQKKDE